MLFFCLQSKEEKFLFFLWFHLGNVNQYQRIPQFVHKHQSQIFHLNQNHLQNEYPCIIKILSETKH